MSAIETVVSEGEKIKDPIHLIENQADRGGNALMLPATHTREMIIRECNAVQEYANAGELYEKAGAEMRKELAVPEFRIRMRMIQLGHLDAKGAMNKVDRNPLEPFAFDHDAWRDSDHTFIVSPAKVNALKAKNPEFRELLDSGDYIYADGHVVRNRPEFVRWNKEREAYLLTEWAKANVDKCCLRFIQKYVQKHVGRYVYGRMYYDAEYVRMAEFYLDDLINQKQMSLPDAIYEYEKAFPEKFKDAFAELLHKNNETQESFAPQLGLSDRRLREWLREPKRFFTADHIVKISLMWKLPDFMSSLLLESLDITLNKRDARNRALMYILHVLWDRGVDEANRYLKDNGLDTLAA